MGSVSGRCVKYFEGPPSLIYYVNAFTTWSIMAKDCLGRHNVRDDQYDLLSFQ
jgi:hypothetical protein